MTSGMRVEGTIWEERRAVLKRGALPEFRKVMVSELWPLLTQYGAPPLCVLSGLIGMPAEETYTFTRFDKGSYGEQMQQHLVEIGPGGDPERRQALREAFARRRELIAEESVRLHRASPIRPKPETPKEDRRAVYGMRRFTIRAADWTAFLEHSSEGVWKRIEAQDACILGLFRDAAATDPLEVTLLTGYHGPGHWEETRFWRDRPADFPEQLWEQGRKAQAARNALTLRSHVCLMTAHWPED